MLLRLQRPKKSHSTYEACSRTRPAAHMYNKGGGSRITPYFQHHRSASKISTGTKDNTFPSPTPPLLLLPPGRFKPPPSPPPLVTSTVRYPVADRPSPPSPPPPRPSRRVSPPQETSPCTRQRACRTRL